jgi:hypothetical protein
MPLPIFQFSHHLLSLSFPKRAHTPFRVVGPMRGVVPRLSGFRNLHYGRCVHRAFISQSNAITTMTHSLGSAGYYSQPRARDWGDMGKPISRPLSPGIPVIWALSWRTTIIYWWFLIYGLHKYCSDQIYPLTEIMSINPGKVWSKPICFRRSATFS